MNDLLGLMSGDSINVISPEGVRQDNVRCQFDYPKILVPGTQLDATEGFRVERPLPNGRIEHYVVEDVHYSPPQFGAIPAFYELSVRKASAPAHPPGQSIVYNVSGQNARVNVNSSDASVNIAQIELQGLFQRMRVTAQELPTPEARNEVVSAIDDMESQAGREGFGGAYQKFIASLADHLTVFGPFLPALAQLLVR
jgi:hypothetical protein